MKVKKNGKSKKRVIKKVESNFKVNRGAKFEKFKKFIECPDVKGIQKLLKKKSKNVDTGDDNPFLKYGSNLTSDTHHISSDDDSICSTGEENDNFESRHPMSLESKIIDSKTKKLENIKRNEEFKKLFDNIKVETKSLSNVILHNNVSLTDEIILPEIDSTKLSKLNNNSSEITSEKSLRGNELKIKKIEDVIAKKNNIQSKNTSYSDNASDIEDDDENTDIDQPEIDSDDNNKSGAEETAKNIRQQSDSITMTVTEKSWPNKPRYYDCIRHMMLSDQHKSDGINYLLNEISVADYSNIDKVRDKLMLCHILQDCISQQEGYFSHEIFNWIKQLLKFSTNADNWLNNKQFKSIKKDQIASLCSEPNLNVCIDCVTIIYKAIDLLKSIVNNCQNLHAKEVLFNPLLEILDNLPQTNYPDFLVELIDVLKTKIQMVLSIPRPLMRVRKNITLVPLLKCDMKTRVDRKQTQSKSIKKKIKQEHNSLKKDYKMYGQLASNNYMDKVKFDRIYRHENSKSLKCEMSDR